MESEKKSSAISNFGAWGMNVVSSVGIIMANKQLMSNNGYAFTMIQKKNFSEKRNCQRKELLCKARKKELLGT
jgi:hypothetical protein